jgi:hypothetical protein
MEVDGSPVLVAGYVAERQDFIPTALRVHAWSLDFRRLPPDIRLCTFLTGEESPYQEGLTLDLRKVDLDSASNAAGGKPARRRPRLLSATRPVRDAYRDGVPIKDMPSFWASRAAV